MSRSGLLYLALRRERSFRYPGYGAERCWASYPALLSPTTPKVAFLSMRCRGLGASGRSIREQTREAGLVEFDKLFHCR